MGRDNQGSDMTVRMACFAIVLICGACAPFQNLSVSDLRTDLKMRHAGTIQMPIEKALLCAEKTKFACGNQGGAAIEIDPEGSGAFSMFLYGMGLTQINPYMVLDFSRGDSGTTAYKGYTAMSTWASTIPDQIQRIEACGDCSKIP